MLLTKSPNGIARTPFLPVVPASRTRPAGDDAGEDEGHPDEDHEVRGVLSRREAGDHGVVQVRDEGVLDDVGEEADQDRHGTGARQARDAEAAGQGGEAGCGPGGSSHLDHLVGSIANVC
jgi:hypothetical protein